VVEKVRHYPVMLEETISLLSGGGRRLFVDATIGLGGHAYELLRRNPDAYLIGIDKDEDALEIAKERLKEFEGRFSLYKADYRDIDEVLKAEGVEKVDGILMDLGVSMLQLKTPERGFSFRESAPLDMRMDRSQPLTAKEVVNRYPERELERIIREYGEERFARRIARAIVRARLKKPIETTDELASIVEGAIPKGFYKKIHPATKTFQAIRMEVNKELPHLREALLKIPSLLNQGGRVAVISFHSLEDRVVKHTFREFEREGTLRVLTKKPITPSEEEVKENPPSRSAKLRTAERV